MITFTVEDGTGLSTATSYVSVEEADDIAVLNIHNSDAWLALPLDNKRQLLMYVARSLDARTEWYGTKTTTVQALEWPRTDAVDKYGNALAANAVPFNVRWAVVELAKWNLSTDRLSNEVPENVISEVKVDAITLKFDDATSIALDQFKVPEIVTDLLKGLGKVRNSRAKVTFAKAVRA